LGTNAAAVLRRQALVTGATLAVFGTSTTKFAVEWTTYTTATCFVLETIAVSATGAKCAFGKTHAAYASRCTLVTVGAKVVGNTVLQTSVLAIKSQALAAVATIRRRSTHFTGLGTEGDGFGLANATSALFAWATVGVRRTFEVSTLTGIGDTHGLTRADVRATESVGTAASSVARLHTTLAFFETDTDATTATTIICAVTGMALLGALCQRLVNTGTTATTEATTTVGIGATGAFFLVGKANGICFVLGQGRGLAACRKVHQRFGITSVRKTNGVAHFVGGCRQKQTLAPTAATGDGVEGDVGILQLTAVVGDGSGKRECTRTSTITRPVLLRCQKHRGLAIAGAQKALALSAIIVAKGRTGRLGPAIKCLLQPAFDLGFAHALVAGLAGHTVGIEPPLQGELVVSPFVGISTCTGV
jgi:hypothetical protein